MSTNPAAASLNGPAKDSQAAPPAEGSSQPQEQMQNFLRAKLLSATFGDIVALLAKSPAHRHYSLADFDWCILPPFTLNQFIVAEAKLANGHSVPAGLVFWARVSADIDARLTQAPRYPIRLHPNEWRSGDVFWIVDTVGDPKVVQNMIAQLANTAFEGKPFKMLSSPDGTQLMAKQMEHPR